MEKGTGKGNKPYNLDERTLLFAGEVVNITGLLPKTIANREFVKQMIRSSGSVGANYIEASESLGQKTSECVSGFVEKKRKKLYIGLN